MYGPCSVVRYIVSDLHPLAGEERAGCLLSLPFDVMLRLFLTVWNGLQSVPIGIASANSVELDLGCT